jgi:hypothetical protein
VASLCLLRLSNGRSFSTLVGEASEQSKVAA